MKFVPAAAAVAFALTLLVACSKDSQPVASPSPDSMPTIPPGTATMTSDASELEDYLTPPIEGPLSPDGLQAILGTTDLGVGLNRVGFVLTSLEELITVPIASVSSRYLASGAFPGELKETIDAEFRPWPYGVRGLYTAHMTFDTPGSWAFDIGIADPDGSVRMAQLFFEVAETTLSPPVGTAAVGSRNKTLGDVETLAELTTGSLQDPDLYRTTLAEAIESGMPTVVVFASPAFCTNAVCGPQLEVLQELKDRHKGQANFIHIDFYDNPDEIQGDLERARLSPAVREWRLPSIEWTFVIDREGNVSARFEAFATIDELEAALTRVM